MSIGGMPPRLSDVEVKKEEEEEEEE